MKKFLVFSIFIFSSVFGFAQTIPIEKPDTVSLSQDQSKDTTIFTYAEVMPVFTYGQGGFQQYLSENVVYPKAELMAHKEGIVYIAFVIEKDGSVSNIKVAKEVPGAPGFTAEALRVIQNMPKWSPAMMNGKPVRMDMAQPLRFRIDDNKSKKKSKKH